jgi:hypothetical protein
MTTALPVCDHATVAKMPYVLFAHVCVALAVGLGDGLDEPLGLGVGEPVGLGVGVTVGVVVLVLVGDAVGETVGVGLGPTWFDDTTIPTMIPATARTTTMATIIHAEREDFLRPPERGACDTVVLRIVMARDRHFPATTSQ